MMLEEGDITLDQYLDRTIFYQPRKFGREEFKNYMFSLSKPRPDVLEFSRSLAGKYLMATINNESREMNEYRIKQFGLSQIVDLFVSSCYVGMRKPDAKIYRVALDLIQKAPPGLTGLWQVSGRNRLSFEDMVRLDIAYLRRWSIGLDFKLLAKTIPTVLLGTGH